MFWENSHYISQEVIYRAFWLSGIVPCIKYLLSSSDDSGSLVFMLVLLKASIKDIPLESPILFNENLAHVAY